MIFDFLHISLLVTVTKNEKPLILDSDTKKT